jgi:hypothetical protein
VTRTHRVRSVPGDDPQTVITRAHRRQCTLVGKTRSCRVSGSVPAGARSAPGSWSQASRSQAMAWTRYQAVFTAKRREGSRFAPVSLPTRRWSSTLAWTRAPCSRGQPRRRGSRVGREHGRVGAARADGASRCGWPVLCIATPRARPSRGSRGGLRRCGGCGRGVRRVCRPSVGVGPRRGGRGRVPGR